MNNKYHFRNIVLLFGFRIQANLLTKPSPPVKIFYFVHCLRLRDVKTFSFLENLILVPRGPASYLCPGARIFSRRSWWDEALKSDEIERWEAWLESLQQLENLKIDRCFKSSDLVGPLTYKMHHFADASKLAYGAVSYLRVTDSDSRVRCVFLMRKGHLAPALTTTILAALTPTGITCCSYRRSLGLYS